MKRLFWFGVGTIAGASGTIWTERKVRSRIEALQPDHLVVSAGHRAKSIGRTVVDAVAEGRGAMREREADLRERLDLDPSRSSTPSWGGAAGFGPAERRAGREPTRPMNGLGDRTARPRHR